MRDTRAKNRDVPPKAGRVATLIEIVPLTRDTDGPCTTKCDNGDWSAQVKQENLSAVKQEHQDVRCVGFMWQQFINVCERNTQSIFDLNCLLN